jgi:hypothetical protein
VQKPTQSVKYQLWYLKKKIMEGVFINIPWKIFQGRQSSWPLGVSVKGIVRCFNWHKCLGGFLHLKPTVGCQISTLIFLKKIMEGGLYKYSMKNILGTAKFSPLHNCFFKYQSWYLTPYCGLEVQKLTQALKSVKGPVNTFDLIPKWSRTLPSLIYFSWDITWGLSQRYFPGL